jgi:hypothetical protein
MLHLNAKEIIEKALEVSQVGSADIPFSTHCALLDAEYRRLQGDLVRSGRSGIIRRAPLIEAEHDPVLNHRQFLLPPDCSRILRVFRVGSFGAGIEEIIENNQAGPGTYYQRDGVILTESVGPLWVEYAPILRTPTFTRSIQVKPFLAAYDATRETEYYLMPGGTVSDSNGNVWNDQVYLQVIATDRRVLLLGTNGVVDAVNPRVVVSGTFDEMFYDPSGDDVYVHDGNGWHLDGSDVDGPSVRWGLSRVFLDGTDLMMDDAVIQEDVELFIPTRNILVCQLTTGGQACVPFVGDAWTLRYDTVTSADESEKTGLGVVGTVKGETVLGGIYPNTRFEFYKTVYYDVLIYRMAMSYMSLTGLLNNGVAPLLATMEEEAFKQNVRSHTPMRSKNIRR